MLVLDSCAMCMILKTISTFPASLGREVARSPPPGEWRGSGQRRPGGLNGNKSLLQHAVDGVLLFCLKFKL